MQTFKILQNSPHKLSSIETPKSKVKICNARETHIVSKSEILFLKSDSNYCEVYLISGKKLLSSQTLKSLSGKLKSSQFFRPHNSYVININFLTSVSSSMDQLTLCENFQVPIARSKKAEMKSMMNVWFD